MSARIPRRVLLRGAGLSAAAVAGLAASTPVRPGKAQSLVVAGRSRAGGWDDVGVIVWGSQDRSQYGHLVLPQRGAWGRERLPVIVFFHGGGWRETSSWDYVLGAARDLARYGAAVWLPAYRGTPSPGGWPVTLQDAVDGFDAVAELGAHAAFTPDLDRVHLLGHSAGGHLAAWLGGLPRGVGSSEEFGPTRIRPVSATALAGVLDPVRAVEVDDDQFVIDLLGGRPSEVPHRYRSASPLQQLPVDLPINVVHGMADATVPAATILPYLERRRISGGRGRVELIDGAEHNDLIDTSHPSWAVAREVCLEAVGAPDGR